MVQRYLQGDGKVAKTFLLMTDHSVETANFILLMDFVEGDSFAEGVATLTPIIDLLQWDYSLRIAVSLLQGT